MKNTLALRRCLVILGAIVLCPMWLAAQQPHNKVRIIQTNSAGDNVHVIDPATNKVVGVIEGIEVNHGAGAAPDGSRIYISDEAREHARRRRREDAQGHQAACRSAAIRTTWPSARTASACTSASSRSRAAWT